MAAAALAGCGKADVPWNTNPGYAGHTRYFPLVGGAHAGVDCNTCHGAYDTFRQFDCLGCHAQPATDTGHQGIAGYAWQSPACYACHPTGKGHTFFPIGGSAKHAATCDGCHSDPARRTDVTTLLCAQCHASLGVDAQHSSAGVLDYQASSPLCLRCHDASTVQLVANHPSGDSTFKGNSHHPEKCLTCHPGILATPANSAGATWAADWGSRGCSACHNGTPGG